jgi:hypothetical protein
MYFSFAMKTVISLMETYFRISESVKMLDRKCVNIQKTVLRIMAIMKKGSVLCKIVKNVNT